MSSKWDRIRGYTVGAMIIVSLLGIIAIIAVNMLVKPTPFLALALVFYSFVSGALFGGLLAYLKD